MWFPECLLVDLMWFGLYGYVCSYELNGKIQANKDTNTEIAQAQSTEKLFLYVYIRNTW
jgi:hypothetical protein